MTLISQHVAPGQWTQLLTLMDNDPHFRYVTFDGMFWVDPFAGRLVYAPMNVRDAIVKHFRQHNHLEKRCFKASATSAHHRLAALLETKLA